MADDNIGGGFRSALGYALSKELNNMANSTQLKGVLDQRNQTNLQPLNDMQKALGQLHQEASDLALKMKKIGIEVEDSEKQTAKNVDKNISSAIDAIVDKILAAVGDTASKVDKKIDEQVEKKVTKKIEDAGLKARIVTPEREKEIEEQKKNKQEEELKKLREQQEAELAEYDKRITEIQKAIGFENGKYDLNRTPEQQKEDLRNAVFKYGSKDVEEALGRAGKELSDQSSQQAETNQKMSVGMQIATVALQQILDVVTVISQKVKAGRDEAAQLYESNLSNVASRGVATRGQLKFLPTTTGWDLLSQGLYANLSVNQVNTEQLGLMNKGYSYQDAISMGMEDAITKKIAPYLDTSSTAFKDLQNKFGDEFLTEMRGMNNYVQEIAGSAKVFEQNINSIVTSLEPVQLWAEKQMWGEEELAALDYLVEQGGMTQQEAANLIQSALKVSTDQYGSITGGTTLEKIAVATGQTDFGAALTSILTNAQLASSSNPLQQGGALQAIGAKGFIAENQDIPATLSMYLYGLNKAKTSGTSTEEKAEENESNFMKGLFTSQSERVTNLAKNVGSQFAFFKETMPIVSEQLDKMLSLQRRTNILLTFLNALQAKQLIAQTGEAAGTAINSITNLVGGSGNATAVLSKVGGAVGKAAIPLAIVAAAAGLISAIGGAVENKKGKEIDASGVYSLNSYDTGTDYVPYTQIAQIHEGEGILTKEENTTYQMQKSNITNKLLQGQIEVKINQEEKNDKLILAVKNCTEAVIAAIKKYNEKQTTYVYDKDTYMLNDNNSVV